MCNPHGMRRQLRKVGAVSDRDAAVHPAGVGFVLRSQTLTDTAWLTAPHCLQEMFVGSVTVACLRKCEHVPVIVVPHN